MTAARFGTPPRPGRLGSRGRARARLLATGVVALALLVVGCDSSTPTYKPPPAQTPVAPGSPSVIDALAALQNRANYVLEGSAQPRPLFLDWKSIESGTVLSKGKASALCRALEVTGADDALSTIALLALNAVSERFRHKPFIGDPDTEAMFEKAVGFVAASCPVWQPQLVSAIGDVFPTASPTAADPETVVGDPGLRWYMDPPGSITDCRHPSCWRAEVLSESGCADRLRMTMAITDRNSGLVVGTAPFESNGPWPAGVMGPFDMWWEAEGSFSGTVTSISCL